MRNGLTISSLRTRTEKVLLIFMESGTIYTALWTFTLVSKACLVFVISKAEHRSMAEIDHQSNYPSRLAPGVLTGPHWSHLYWFTYYVTICPLVEFVSIYPTIVILLVERTSSYYNRTLRLESVRTPWQPPTPKRDSPSLLDTEDFSADIGGISSEDQGQLDTTGEPAEPSQAAVPLASRVHYTATLHTETAKQLHRLRSTSSSASSAL
ncbi:hypothetical protein PsYK624_033490 [Phanerochaete sordida]|uniref:Uncharacterized protein n=1 Tax=Phanerochaete sordida TaxID=48140 RepID=A0A9P3L9H1_9APHY|nr:hypothetical protein PsYK624_033490 [Phanerochaete sordida]